MPWSAADADKHTHAANTPRLRVLWAKVANERLEAGADDATAIREANAAVNAARGRGRGYRMIALSLALLLAFDRITVSDQRDNDAVHADRH